MAPKTMVFGFDAHFDGIMSWRETGVEVLCSLLMIVGRE